MTGPSETTTEGYVLVNEEGEFLCFSHVLTHVGTRTEVRTTDKLHQATVNPSFLESRSVAGKPLKRLPVRVTRKVEVLPEPLDFTLKG